MDFEVDDEVDNNEENGEKKYDGDHNDKHEVSKLFLHTFYLSGDKYN